MKYQATYNTKLQERTHKLHRKSRSRSMKRYNKQKDKESKLQRLQTKQHRQQLVKQRQESQQLMMTMQLQTQVAMETETPPTLAIAEIHLIHRIIVAAVSRLLLNRSVGNWIWIIYHNKIYSLFYFPSRLNCKLLLYKALT